MTKQEILQLREAKGERMISVVLDRVRHKKLLDMTTQHYRLSNKSQAIRLIIDDWFDYLVKDGKMAAFRTDQLDTLPGKRAYIKRRKKKSRVRVLDPDTLEPEVKLERLEQ